jgi:hypothetical protein
VHDFFDSMPIHLEWEPGSEGDIYLLATTPIEQRLWLLEDTGSYDLDLGSLGLKEGDTVDLVLGRWSHATVDHDGHEVVIDVQSNQMIRGSWRTIGSRIEMLDSYDECVDAQSAPSAVPGNYYGELLGSTPDLNPTPTGCTGFAATGIDRVVPIDLLPEDLLTVNYQLVSDDASLYLVTDCSNALSCLVGRDSGARGDVEQIVWFNDTGAELRVYAVLDAFNDVTDMYNLDIIIESLGGDILVPTCVDAIAQGPAAAGSYHGSISGYADLLEPSCAAPATGAEGMTQILLQPGERLIAEVEAPSGDPKLYLLSNCAIGDSCFLASTTDSDEFETLEYVNTSFASQFMYLVLDADQNLDEYFLDIAIQ